MMRISKPCATTILMCWLQRPMMEILLSGLLRPASLLAGLFIVLFTHTTQPVCRFICCAFYSYYSTCLQVYLLALMVVLLIYTSTLIYIICRCFLVLVAIHHQVAHVCICTFIKLLPSTMYFVFCKSEKFWKTEKKLNYWSVS